MRRHTWESPAESVTNGRRHSGNCSIVDTNLTQISRHDTLKFSWKTQLWTHSLDTMHDFLVLARVKVLELWLFFYKCVVCARVFQCKINRPDLEETRRFRLFAVGRLVKKLSRMENFHYSFISWINFRNFDSYNRRRPHLTANDNGDDMQHRTESKEFV